MTKERIEEYRALINASPVFTLDPIKQESAYERERHILLINLWNYLMEYNKYIYGDRGSEFMNVFQSCIKSFDPEKGDFLNYFIKSISRESWHARAKENADKMRSGVAVSPSDQRALNSLLKLFKSNGIEYLSEDEISFAAERLNKPTDYIRRLIKLNSDAVVIKESSVDTDNEKEGFIDSIASTDMTPDESLDEKRRAYAVLSKIEEVFLSCQDRQKRLASMLITCELCSTLTMLTAQGYDLTAFNFIHKGVMRYYMTRGEVPTQRMIADKVGRDEVSISRTKSTLKSKIASILNNHS